MAIISLTEIKTWFTQGKYPTEQQFSNAWDSFRHKEDTVSLQDVEELDERLNSKYERSAGEAVEKKADEAFDRIEEVSYRLDVTADTLSEARVDIQTISDMLGRESYGMSLEEAKEALVALGPKYGDLFSLASTFKSFLESTDMVDTTINTWKEIESFLVGITDRDSLSGLLAQLSSILTEAYTAAIDEAILVEKNRAQNAEYGITQAYTAVFDAFAAKAWTSDNFDPSTILENRTGTAMHIWSGSQAEYDSISNKETDTIYFIV